MESNVVGTNEKRPPELAGTGGAKDQVCKTLLQHNDTPCLVGLKDAASRLGISKRKVEELVARQVLAPVRIDGRVLLRLADLRHWIDAGCPTDPREAARVCRRGGAA